MNKMRKVIHAGLNMASIGSKNEDFPSGTSEVPGMGNKRIEMIVEKETAEVTPTFWCHFGLASFLFSCNFFLLLDVKQSHRNYIGNFFC